MQITSISVGRSVQINLGNYSSTKLDVMLTAKLDEQDNPGEVYKKLANQCKQALKYEALKIPQVTEQSLEFFGL